MAQAGVFQRERLPICKAVQVGYESDPSAAAEIKQLEEKLIGQSRQLRDQVNSWVAPWRSKWQAADGWTDKLAMLNAAHDRGLEKGVETWTQDQVSFLQEVVQFGEEAGKWVEGQGEEAVSWYSDLSLVEKVFWPVALGDEAADKITKELGPLAKEWQTLWDNRQHILTLFKALVSNSVNAVQLAIEALAKMGGEIGELMQMLWDKGDDWVQALIETCRETRAIQVVFSTLGAIAAAFPPNLWVEAASTAAGYVLPEILIAVILAIIAALSDGAAAPLLVARITSYVAKVKRMVTKMGDLGELLLKVFDGIKPLAETITQLVKALWKNIAEKVDGVLGDVKFIRRSRVKPKFRTLGVDDNTARDYFSSEDGRQLLSKLSEADPDADSEVILSRAIEQVKSGAHLPEIKRIEKDAVLVKMVPEGNNVSDFSPYFTSPDELERLSKSKREMDGAFALPSQSAAPNYSVYKIAAKQDEDVYVSRVAPSIEGSVRHPGGAKQYIVVDRSKWSKPVLVGKIKN